MIKELGKTLTGAVSGVIGKAERVGANAITKLRIKAANEAMKEEYIRLGMLVCSDPQPKPAQTAQEGEKSETLRAVTARIATLKGEVATLEQKLF